MPCGRRIASAKPRAVVSLMPRSSSPMRARSLSSRRSTTLSPCSTGTVETRTSTWRSCRRRRMRPSCGTRRSAMSRSAMILRRLTIAALRCAGGAGPSWRTPSMRYRIDGVLQDGPAPPAHLKAAIVSRLKIMADLDIAERRVPQDGRIRLRLQDRQVDVRVSTVPVLHGESVVLRLLDKERARIGLEDLGMSDTTARGFAEAIRRPHGIVLSTGPTGSGKTTTLYAAIDQIRTGREKILTVEDPV